jgi:hypothetical protein
LVTIAGAGGVTINGTPLTLATSKGGTLIRTASDTWTFIPTGSGGKVLQVVRATDTTSRSTTSTSFVDVTGMSVTITPKSATSSIILNAIFSPNVSSTTTASRVGFFQITDSSNVAISGAQNLEWGLISGTTYTMYGGLNMQAYVTTGSTSAVTYKLRFSVNAASTTVLTRNDLSTGQMFATEVEA